MARTVEAPGWTSQFREIILSVSADLHDLRSLAAGDPALDPDNYAASQALAVELKEGGAEGLVYPSIRHPGGECVGLFYPDSASDPTQGRSEEHTSALQSLMRISYAVFCLKKKKIQNHASNTHH